MGKFCRTLFASEVLTSENLTAIMEIVAACIKNIWLNTEGGCMIRAFLDQLDNLKKTIITPTWNG